MVQFKAIHRLALHTSLVCEESLTPVVVSLELIRTLARWIFISHADPTGLEPVLPGLQPGTLPSELRTDLPSGYRGRGTPRAVRLLPCESTTNSLDVQGNWSLLDQ